uniref:Uncharacterized protein n=1 Tax=Cucumis melo TaxID=3656 RepID=A0A9I9EIY4_CUCME
MKGKKEKRRVPNLLHDFFFCTKHLSPNPSALFSLAQGRTDSSTYPIPSSPQALARHLHLSSSVVSCFSSLPPPSSNFFALRLPFYLTTINRLHLVFLDGFERFYSNFGLLALGCTFDIYELLDLECLREKVWRKPLENWRHRDKNFQAWKGDLGAKLPQEALRSNLEGKGLGDLGVKL